MSVPAGGQPWRLLLGAFDGDGRAGAVAANTEESSISILSTR